MFCKLCKGKGHKITNCDYLDDCCDIIAKKQSAKDPDNSFAMSVIAEQLNDLQESVSSITGGGSSTNGGGVAKPQKMTIVRLEQCMSAYKESNPDMTALDTGATIHLCSRKKLMQSIHPVSDHVNLIGVTVDPGSGGAKVAKLQLCGFTRYEADFLAKYSSCLTVHRV